MPLLGSRVVDWRIIERNQPQTNAVTPCKRTISSNLDRGPASKELRMAEKVCERCYHNVRRVYKIRGKDRASLQRSRQCSSKNLLIRSIPTLRPKAYTPTG